MWLRITLAVLLGTINLRSLLAQSSANWESVGGDRGGMRYSTLDQINRSNVSSLEEAWIYHTGELVDGKGKTIECTPLIVDGKMFLTTAERRVVSLDGATGKVLWEFDPKSYGPLAGPLASGGVNRGVAYWIDPQDPSIHRIFHGTSDGRLYSLDARTGKLDLRFGKGGAKDLREDLEVDIGSCLMVQPQPLLCMATWSCWAFPMVRDQISRRLAIFEPSTREQELSDGSFTPYLGKESLETKRGLRIAGKIEVVPMPGEG